MQSVIYGLDKNPKITAADPKAKFIAAANKKKKKKVIYCLDQVYMQTYMLKENVEARCEKKVQRVPQKHLTLNEQNKQRGKNND